MVQWLGAVGGIAEASQGCVLIMPVHTLVSSYSSKTRVRSVETVLRSCQNSLYITVTHPVTSGDRIQPPIDSVCLQLQNDMKEFPKFDHLLHWRCSCCQLKNMASVKVALIETEKAARLGWILSLSRTRNSSVIYTDVISVRACPVYMCVHVQDFVPVGVRFDSGLLKGPFIKWIYFDCL